MSKYAKIQEDVVVNIIVCEDSEIFTQNGHHVKVTESTNDAQIGYEYNLNKNKFKSPQPFQSWVLNEESFIWEAPVSRPVAEGSYRWDEEAQSWATV
jgi:hypothetical protein